MRDRLQLVSTCLLALLVAWAPLPFASVTRLGQAGIQIGSFALLVLTILVGRSSSMRRAAIPAAAIAAIGLMGFAQSLPAPASILALVSPRHATLFAGAEGLAGATAHPCFSLAPSTSRAAARTWLAAGAIMLATAGVGFARLHRRILGGAVLLAAMFEMAFGTRRWLSESRSIWGVDIPETSDRLRGTFVNPNHLATYLELALVLAFAWGWVAMRRSRGAPVDVLLVNIAPPVVLWVTLLACISFTGSRGGILAAAAGAAIQGSLAAIRARPRRRWLALATGLLVAGGGIGLVLLLGQRTGLERLSGTRGVAWEVRTTVYRLSLDLCRMFPLTGTGLATFRDAFPLVQPPSLEGSWWHAHSDVLELLVTTGIVGGAIVALGLATILLRVWRVWRTGERSEDRAAGLAAIGALVSLSVHSCLDFGLTMPANAVTTAMILGAAAAVATKRARGAARQPPLGASSGSA